MLILLILHKEKPQRAKTVFYINFTIELVEINGSSKLYASTE